MKIAVRFSDNNFGNTFNGVMRTLYDAYKFSGYLPQEHKEIKDIVNSLSPVCYRIYQDYDGRDDGYLQDYLMIKESQVMVGDEVDAYIKECDGWDNSETFIIDTEIYDKIRYPGYLNVYRI